MSTEQNKATFRRLHESVNTGDRELVIRTINEIIHPDAVLHLPVPPSATGARGIEQIMTVLLRAYPDLHIEVEDQIAEDDKVVGRSVVTGTHRGEHLGLPPTGKTVRYNEIFVFRFTEGRVVEIWGVADVFAQLKQLGAIAAA